jgi:hypothetical protein
MLNLFEDPVKPCERHKKIKCSFHVYYNKAELRLLQNEVLDPIWSLLVVDCRNL